jgi:hypothetical protein
VKQAMHVDLTEETSEKVALQRLGNKVKKILRQVFFIHIARIEKWVLVLSALNMQVILPDIEIQLIKNHSGPSLTFLTLLLLTFI